MIDRPADRPTSSEEVPRLEGPISQSSLVIGPYRLLQRLGEGGMGEVWLAEQTAPVRRHVAVKVIKAGMDTLRVVARFEVERQALAGQEKYAEAEPFLLAGHEGMSRREATMPFENRSELDRGANWIVQLYRDSRRLEKAAEWEERLR